MPASLTLWNTLSNVDVFLFHFFNPLRKPRWLQVLVWIQTVELGRRLVRGKQVQT